MSPSTRASVVPAPQPPPLSAPRIKRKKSAFAIGLAKLVPSVLRKSSVAVKSEQVSPLSRLRLEPFEPHLTFFVPVPSLPFDRSSSPPPLRSQA